MPAPSLPPSPPAPSATATPRRRRNRRPLPPSSSPATSFSSSTAPSFYPPSPSPFHRFIPSTSVPFSWEHRPGIPKTPARSRSSSNKPLPLPPSRAADPYDASSVVPAEYADVRIGRMRVLRRRKRPVAVDAIAQWLSVLSLYRSCRRAAASCFAAKLNSA